MSSDHLDNESFTDFEKVTHFQALSPVALSAGNSMLLDFSWPMKFCRQLSN